MRNTGEMNHRLALYTRTVNNSTGTAVESKQLLMEVWGARRDMSGREFTQAAAVQAEKTVIFTIRRPARKQIDSGVLVEEKGYCYRVVDVVENPVWPGCLDLRAIGTRMEGMGHADNT